MLGKRRLVVLAVVLTGFYLVPAAVGARPAGPLVPRTGALFGAFADMGQTGWHQNEVSQFEQLVGRRLDIDQRYYTWTAPFPGVDEDWDAAAGRLPLITWEPWGTNLDAIRSGAFDPMIRERAAGLRDFGRPVFLRFAHEMNGDWYPWAGALNNDPGRANGPAKYVATWRRVHDLFAEEGASNVVWVWCPNRNSFPSTRWNDFRAYYPGDAYVDWVCIDGYNHGSTEDWSTWRSFESVFRPIYDAYAAVKPIMIGETGSVELGGDKAQWIRDMHAAVKTEFPSVAAFLWFNIDKNGHDWRVDSSAASLDAYRAMGTDPYFNVGDAVSPGSSGLAVTALPSTSGGYLKGETRLGTPGEWAAPPETTFALQWNRCDRSGASCRPIADATSNAYAIAEPDVGQTLRVIATATDSAGATSAASVPSPVIAQPVKIVRLAVLPTPPIRFASIRFVLNQKTVVSVRILDKHGRVIRHRKRNAVYRAGPVRIRWWGRANSGARVPRGRRYGVLVIARPMRDAAAVPLASRRVSFVLAPRPTS